MTMQDRYVGDLGDFGKYGLLTALCSWPETVSDPHLSLGVVWYLVPDEGHNQDGKYVQYLVPSARNQEQFRSCDPFLYDVLGGIVGSGRRRVDSVRERDVLPAGTRYYDSPLTFNGLSGSAAEVRRQRAELRSGWLEGALESTARCELVFMDPDNGIEVKVGAYQKRGPKYVFFNELIPFSNRGQSLVVYHHMSRRGSSIQQVKERLAQIEDRLGRGAFALLYHRGSARAFFVIPVEEHEEDLRSKAKKFLEGPWSRHFELVTPA